MFKMTNFKDLRKNFLLNILAQHQIVLSPNASFFDIYQAIFKLSPEDPWLVYQQLKKHGFNFTDYELNALDLTNLVSTWHYLAQTDEGISVIEALFEEKILNVKAILNKKHVNDNTSFWFHLTKTDKGIDLFSRCLKEKINQIPLPEKTIFSLQTVKKENAWQHLSYSQERINAFEALLDKNYCLPDSKDLSIRNTINNKNCWTYLSETSEGLQLIKKLIKDYNLTPDTKDLDSNFWQNLAKNSPEGIEIFHLLLDNDIIPRKSTLDSFVDVTQKPFNPKENCWAVLAKTRAGCQVILKLFNKQLLDPVSKLEFTDNPKEPHAFFSIAKNYGALFKFIVKSGYLPTTQACNQTFENSNNHNIWNILIDEYPNNSLRILNENHILPENKLFLTGLDSTDNIIRKINKRVQTRKALKEKNSLSNEMALVFSETKPTSEPSLKNSIFAFLLLNRGQAKEKKDEDVTNENPMTYTGISLPKEILLRISYFSHSVQVSLTIKDILSNTQNQIHFIKQAVINGLDEYIEKFFQSHAERAKTFREAISNTSSFYYSKNSTTIIEKDKSLGFLLNSQYSLFRNNNVYSNLKKPKKYQQPIKNIQKQDQFFELIKECLWLTKLYRPAKKIQEVDHNNNNNQSEGTNVRKINNNNS